MPVSRGVGVHRDGKDGTTPQEHRLAMAGLIAENDRGKPRAGLLAPSSETIVATDSNGMFVYVLPLQAVITRDQDGGVYTPTTQGWEEVHLKPAPASGSRWDLIWIKQNDKAKGDKDNTAVLGFTDGTPAASPVKPYAKVPDGALVLAEMRIYAGTNNTAQSPNTLVQTWRHTATRGAPIPVRNETELAEITTSPTSGHMVKRLDLPGKPIMSWNGSSWSPPGPDRKSVV